MDNIHFHRRTREETFHSPSVCVHGLKVVVTRIDTGASLTTAVGDYGRFPKGKNTGFGEVSVAGAQELGATVVYSARVSGPVPKGPDIPVSVTVYPGTAPIPARMTIPVPTMSLSAHYP
jgi:hypothetical protein